MDRGIIPLRSCFAESMVMLVVFWSERRCKHAQEGRCRWEADWLQEPAWASKAGQK